MKKGALAAVGVVLSAAALFFLQNSTSKQQHAKKSPSPSVFHFFSRWAKLNNLPEPSSDEIQSRLRVAVEEVHSPFVRCLPLISNFQACAAFPYRCVQEARFAEPRCTSHSLYSQIFPPQGLSVVGKPVSELRVLDVGACMGTDLRQMKIDGAGEVIGLDIEPEFFPIGTKLFHGTQLPISACEAQLVASLHRCDMLDSAQVQSVIQTLFPAGVDVIYSGSVFHLFTFEQGLQFAMNLFQIATARHASPSSSSGQGVLFGRTVGSTARPFEAPARRGRDEAANDRRQRPQLRYLHSCESLKGLLESVGFIDVQVSTASIDYPEQNRASTMLDDRATMLHFSAKF